MRARFARVPIALAGALAALVPALPAAAATAPTISAPASRIGFGPIDITGTAPAGATVTLIEAAYIFRGDMKPAVDYDTGGTVTAKANASGHYTISRLLDSGFVFAVQAGGMRSPVIKVSIQVLPTLTVSAAGGGNVDVTVAADPGEPGLPVEVQRWTGSAWAVVASGYTDQQAVFADTLTGQGSDIQQYRAYIGGDDLDAVLPNYSATVDSTGAVVSDPIPTPPAPVPPAPVPPAPVPPAVPAAKPGDVQITKIVYDPPGADTGSNTSLNGEYVRLTNKSHTTVDLKGVTLRDAGNHTYAFTSSYRLAPGGNVYVLTGRGTNGKPSVWFRYWGRTSYLWDNTGDTATLRSATGQTMDSCRYTKGAGYTYC